MGDDFRGWKRKLGVVTLLMACVLMVGWVRTHFVAEQFVNCADGCATIDLAGGCIIWSRPTRQVLDVIETQCWELSSPGWEWYTVTFKKMPPELGADFQFVSRFSHLGIEVATAVREKTGAVWRVETVEFWKVSLLDAIIPLTLISARLLLSKPRAAKNPPEPSPK